MNTQLPTYKNQVQAIGFFVCGLHILSQANDVIKPENLGPKRNFSSTNHVTYENPFGNLRNINFKTRSYTLPNTESHINSFKKDISSFYNKLNMSQERLSPDFEKVLIDNLWDLYLD